LAARRGFSGIRLVDLAVGLLFRKEHVVAAEAALMLMACDAGTKVPAYRVALA